LFIILASEKKTHWEWYCNCHFSRARLWTFHSKNDALPFPACVHYCACGKRAHRWDEILVCFKVPFFTISLYCSVLMFTWSSLTWNVNVWKQEYNM